MLFFFPSLVTSSANNFCEKNSMVAESMAILCVHMELCLESLEKYSLIHFIPCYDSFIVQFG